MSVVDAPKAARELLGARMFLVGYLPTFAAVVILGMLTLARVPGGLRFADAWRAVTTMTLGQALAGLLVLTVLVVLLHPLQLPMIRLLEGYWPRWAEPVRAYGRRRQERRMRTLTSAAEVPDTDDVAAVQRAGQAGTRLRAAFPLGDRPLLPTALGNALSAAESRAGREYGFDGIVAWPRLYPMLGEQVRAVVDDRRDGMDAAARFSVTMLVTALLAVPVLAGAGWWLLFALTPLALARIAYRGAVHAAVAYGEAVRVAFDLHRFDLLRALHLPLPADQEAERVLNDRLCTMWRQDPSPRLTYDHGPE